MKLRTVLTFIAFLVILIPVIEPFIFYDTTGNRAIYYICLFVVIGKVSVKLNE